MNDVVELLLPTELGQVLQIVIDLTLLRQDERQIVKRQPLLGEFFKLREDLNARHRRTELNDVVELEKFLSIALNVAFDSRLDALQIAQQLPNVDLVLSIQNQ